ncbi:hypothetical protein APHAL10511_006720 [Amanita phalloides]|nr:hypothetical protein APHAL10511_006720 [Amanita phalloides]
MAARMAIAPVTDDLSVCIPNLMPFHIGYSGPAPISTFMGVEPSHQTVGAPVMDNEHGDNAMGSAPVTYTSNNEDIGVDITQPGGIGTSQEDATNATVVKFDASRRHVSTFRGRTIHGLDVDLPEGYAGLELRTEGHGTTKSAMASSSRDRRQEERTAVKRVTRRSKQIAVRDETGEVEMEMSEKVVRNVEFMDLTDNAEDVDEYLPARMLVPTAQFRSFRLWNADRPADEGADEYTRSLSEWITLAHHIHQVPP